MFSAITLQGFGPHEDHTFNLDPKGTTEILGRSQSGKTTLVEALTFLLWGVGSDGSALNIAYMRSDVDRMTVSAATRTGYRFTRSKARGGAISRVLVDPKGVETSCKTEAEWLAALRGLGQKVDAIRTVIAPMSWVALVMGTGKGRPFRDLLKAVLPGADLRVEIAELLKNDGFEFLATDPTDPKMAEDARRLANTRRDEAKGALTNAHERQAASKATPAAVHDTTAAKKVLKDADTWRHHDNAVAAFNAGKADRDRIIAGIEGWKARRDELGERPACDDAGASRAIALVTDARRNVDSAKQAVGQATAAVTQAETRLSLGATSAENARNREIADAAVALRKAVDDQEAAANAGADCPTCSQPWAEGVAAHEHRLDATNAAVTAAEERVARARAEAVPDPKLATDVDLAKSTLAARQRALEAAELELQARENSAATYQGARHEAAVWDASVKALGTEPKAPTAAPTPTPPTVPRPRPSEVDAAKATIDEASKAAGAAQHAAQEAAAAAAATILADTKHKEAVTTAKRLDALVEACRAAPSAMVRKQLSVLGDLGPVTIDLPDGSGVEILIDGLPWWIASDGRKVVADMWLRAALRRALKLATIPIIVDRVQDVAGQPLPDIGGPVILLRTADCDLSTHTVVATQEAA